MLFPRRLHCRISSLSLSLSLSLCIIFGVARQTFVVEAVDAVDAGALVVAAQQEKVLGVFDLVGQQQANGLQRLPKKERMNE